MQGAGPTPPASRLWAEHRAQEPHDIIDGLAGELCLSLGHEQPGQIVLLGGEVALDGAEFVAGDRVLDTQAALEASDPLTRVLASSGSSSGD